MTTVQVKLDLLQEVIEEDEALSRVLDKFIQVILAQHQTRLERYKAELNHFESLYKMSSSEFYQKFEQVSLVTLWIFLNGPVCLSFNKTCSKR